MSSSTTDTIVYQPTAAEIRAAAEAALQTQVQRGVALAIRAASEADDWRERAPTVASQLDAFAVPVVSTDGDPVTASAAARNLLDDAERTINRLLAAAAAEEARRRARGASDEAEIAAARSGATAVVSLPAIEYEDVGEATVGMPHAQPDQSVAAPGTAAHPALPATDERLDRVVTILGRAQAAVDPVTVGRLLDEAAAASDQVAFQSVLFRARRSVEEADGLNEARERSASEARRLLASIGGLESSELEFLRAHLNRAVSGTEALDPRASTEVAAAVHRATRQRFLDVVTSMGCELASAQDDRHVGYFDQGEGTASRIVVDAKGAILTAVSDGPLDGPTSLALDERNCELHDELARRAAKVGIALSSVSARRPGELPVREEPHPFSKRDQTTTERRRRRIRRTTELRSDER